MDERFLAEDELVWELEGNEEDYCRIETLLFNKDENGLLTTLKNKDEINPVEIFIRDFNNYNNLYVRAFKEFGNLKKLIKIAKKQNAILF